ncbi:MAG: sugar ABC transporter substrate-binding protein [Propionibacteriaceae bacterium]|jgi:ribose transport system substrate-binding protein|nr:sugar ABC transporter substrate-binding protein [Propionibacteriaceae bacterium]
MRTARIAAAAAVASLALLASCTTSSTTAPTAETTTPAGESTEKISIAFFGAAKANSFANAVWAGIQTYAAEIGADAEFFDGEFNAEKQVQQVQDANTSGKYQVYVIGANDGAALIPAVEQAVSQGIKVVAADFPVGTAYDTYQAQVEGTFAIVDAPTTNGDYLGKLGLGACEKLAVDPCQVAYLQGNATLPLDNARTQHVVDTLTAGGITEIYSNLQGGYTQDEGRKAGQDLLQAHPDVDVIIGSTQAILGVEPLVDTSKVMLVGNGGSRQAVAAVQEGKWFGIYYYDVEETGYLAAQMGAKAYFGETVESSIDIAGLDSTRTYGDAANLEGITGTFDD